MWGPLHQVVTRPNGRVACVFRRVAEGGPAREDELRARGLIGGAPEFCPFALKTKRHAVVVRESTSEQLVMISRGAFQKRHVACKNNRPLQLLIF